MTQRYGVALVEGDTVTAEACFPDAGASAISTLAQLRARSDTCWITNFSADELRERRLIGNVANDGFLGVRIASIMAELGLSAATPASARHAVVTLAAIVTRTQAMAEQALGMTDESSIIEAATSTALTGLISETDESAALLMVSAASAMRPPAPSRAGAVVLPLRRQRFVHARDAMGCSIPDGPFDTRVDELDLDAALEDDELMPIMVELGQPMEGLFALGPYGQRPVISIREYRAYLQHRPGITPRVTQAWTAAGWADHSGDLAPIPVILSGKAEGKTWQCGPLQVRGPDVISYSLSLIAEAVWRAITATRSAAAAWLLVTERLQTFGYAMAVDAAARAEGIAEAFRVVAFRHGVVWVETSLPPTEERWSALAQIAERTGLLPPPLPVSAPTEYRYTRACKLFNPRQLCVEKHWLGAMLALGDTSLKRLL